MIALGGRPLVTKIADGAGVIVGDDRQAAGWSFHFFYIVPTRAGKSTAYGNNALGCGVCYGAAPSAYFLPQADIWPLRALS